MKLFILALFSFSAFSQEYGFCEESSSILSIACMEKMLKDKEITELDQVPAQLPQEYLLNFILKHNNGKTGPRGHLHEEDQKDIGQGATPMAPRAIVFGQYEDNGFTVSFVGNDQQKNGHTFDMMEYHKEKGLLFWKADFKSGQQPQLNEDSCITCHGPKEKMRPIFSMYPDWPGFYGSDNDEITNPTMKIPHSSYRETIEVEDNYQQNEFKDFISFREVAKDHPRYAPLFNEEAVKEALNYDYEYNILSLKSRNGIWNVDWAQVPYPITNEYIEDPKAYGVDWLSQTGGKTARYPWSYFYQTFPFRPGHTLVSTRDLSRAFSHRPSLRFNIFISRMHNKNLLRLIDKHISKEKAEKGEKFVDFRPFFLYNTMMCENGRKLDGWFDKASQELSESLEIGKGIRLGNSFEVVEGNIRPQIKVLPEGKKAKILEYDRNWRLLGLSLKDIDMRLSYNHPAYDQYLTNSQPEYNENNKGLLRLGYFEDRIYFNSYNDGSTTTDELIAGTLLSKLVKENSQLQRWLAHTAKDIQFDFKEEHYDETGEKVSQKFTKSFYDDDKKELNLWGLVEKYGRFPQRYTLDRKFFHKMDEHGKWINLPYDPAIGPDHHRAAWWSRYGNNKKHFPQIHKAVCDSLEGVLLEKEPGITEQTF